MFCQKEINISSGFLVYVSEVRYFNRLKLSYKNVISIVVITGCIKKTMKDIFRIIGKTKENFDLGLGEIHASIKLQLVFLGNESNSL